jgi:transposase-like protein
MPRGKKHSAEEIIGKLREAEVLLSQGSTQEQVARSIGLTYQTYCRWRKEYGGMKIDQAKRLKELEKENARLKRLLADAELDKAILKEVASGNF